MKSKISVLGASALVLFVLPALTHAQTVGKFLRTVRGWLNLLVPMLITLGIIAFFWGLAMYLFSDGEEKGKGLNRMMMGILAVFVMASLGGIINILQNTTGAGKAKTINPPCVGHACRNVD